MQTEPGDQQRASIARRSREPIQSDDQPKAERHRCPRAEFCQLESAAVEGAALRAQLLRRSLSE